MFGYKKPIHLFSIIALPLQVLCAVLNHGQSVCWVKSNHFEICRVVNNNEAVDAAFIALDPRLTRRSVSMPRPARGTQILGDSAFLRVREWFQPNRAATVPWLQRVTLVLPAACEELVNGCAQFCQTSRETKFVLQLPFLFENASIGMRSRTAASQVAFTHGHLASASQGT